MLCYWKHIILLLEVIQAVGPKNSENCWRSFSNVCMTVYFFYYHTVKYWISLTVRISFLVTLPATKPKKFGIVWSYTIKITLFQYFPFWWPLCDFGFCIFFHVSCDLEVFLYGDQRNCIGERSQKVSNAWNQVSAQTGWMCSFTILTPYDYLLFSSSATLVSYMTGIPWWNSSSSASSAGLHSIRQLILVLFLQKFELSTRDICCICRKHIVSPTVIGW